MSSERDNMSDINLESSCSMNLRSKRNSSKHDFACADASVSGEPATRQPPELDERHPGKCNSKVEAGASSFHSTMALGATFSTGSKVTCLTDSKLHL